MNVAKVIMNGKATKSKRYLFRTLYNLNNTFIRRFNRYHLLSIVFMAFKSRLTQQILFEIVPKAFFLIRVAEESKVHFMLLIRIADLRVSPLNL